MTTMRGHPLAHPAQPSDHGRSWSECLAQVSGVGSGQDSSQTSAPGTLAQSAAAPAA